jgi:hypothetical protein
LTILLQPPGTSLYLPDKWYHAVVNHQLSASITLAWEPGLPSAPLSSEA